MALGNQLGLGSAARLVSSYGRGLLAEQLKAASPIVVFLLLFHLVILRVPVARGVDVAAGIVMFIAGLALFLEGVRVGLMPLGETIGARLPGAVHPTVVTAFALVVGAGATLAEPAVNALRVFGEGVMPWRAPLLYHLLAVRPAALLGAIAVGVGLAVAFGVLRFALGWSLRLPFLVLVCIAGGLTIYCQQDPGLRQVIGLAWDTGAVTTGPVTVPLVLALGVGVSRVYGRAEVHSGFGLIALASLLPVIAVLLLSLWISPAIPPPTEPARFFDPQTREAAVAVFSDEAHYDRARAAWVSGVDVGRAGDEASPPAAHARSAALAVMPISVFLLAVLLALRSRPRYTDEIVYGILIALLGMALLSGGIDRGLARLGSGVGRNLASSFRTVRLTDQALVIPEFGPELVHTAVDDHGRVFPFFYLREGRTVRTVPFDPEAWDEASRQYTHVPSRGPLLAGISDLAVPVGIAVVFLFALALGFGATLAEPSVAALGRAVEDVTVGLVRKSVLVPAIASGVGVGLVAGVATIMWEIPIAWVLLPAYGIVVLLTLFSDREFLHIAWDTGGVTTGPVTVPLVMAMGQGLAVELGVVEGFGVLALASAFPILLVLVVGLGLSRRHRRSLRA